jgi:hypothetical protein
MISPHTARDSFTDAVLAYTVRHTDAHAGRNTEHSHIPLTRGQGTTHVDALGCGALVH